jgi:hypothetical protein
MKNEKKQGKKGNWVRGEMSSSTGERECVCNPLPPYICVREEGLR